MTAYSFPQAAPFLNSVLFVIGRPRHGGFHHRPRALANEDHADAGRPADHAPVRFDFHVVQGATERGRHSAVMAGAAPIVITMFAMIALLLLIPDLALWWPGLFY
ncbi:hypothetical protein [Nisaea sp.]|uniref:hypothetical protein n=1 Tax=Nisaea sp. TaxID=2024842 RepID=UPI003B522514